MQIGSLRSPGVRKIGRVLAGWITAGVCAAFLGELLFACTGWRPPSGVVGLLCLVLMGLFIPLALRGAACPGGTKDRILVWVFALSFLGAFSVGVVRGLVTPRRSAGDYSSPRLTPAQTERFQSICRAVGANLDAPTTEQRRELWRVLDEGGRLPPEQERWLRDATVGTARLERLFCLDVIEALKARKVVKSEARAACEKQLIQAAAIGQEDVAKYDTSMNQIARGSPTPDVATIEKALHDVDALERRLVKLLTRLVPEER